MEIREVRLVKQNDEYLEVPLDSTEGCTYVMMDREAYLFCRPLLDESFCQFLVQNHVT